MNSADENWFRLHCDWMILRVGNARNSMARTVRDTFDVSMVLMDSIHHLYHVAFLSWPILPSCCWDHLVKNYNNRRKRGMKRLS
jgi:hypothetical protein